MTAMTQLPDNMFSSSAGSLSRVLATPVGRRAMLMLGARGAMGLYTALGAGAALGLFGTLSGCYRAPGTARDQLIFFSEERELQFGISAYREVLRQARLSENPEINEQIQRVGKKIADVANKPEYQWEFAVIEDDKMVNAFALPGGIAGGFILGKVVQGPAVVGDLRRAVGPRSGAQLARIDASAGSGVTGGHQRGPGGCALAITGAGSGGVLGVQIQRHALPIDEERAQLTARAHIYGRCSSGRCRGGGLRCCGSCAVSGTV